MGIAGCAGGAKGCVLCRAWWGGVKLHDVLAYEHMGRCMGGRARAW